MIHHNHKLKENNIIDYICNNYNLKRKTQLIVLFDNSKGYDNNYMIDIFSKIENFRIKNVKLKILKMFRYLILFVKL